MKNGKTPSVAEKAENCLGRTLRKPPSEESFGRTLRKDLKRSSGSVPSEGHVSLSVDPYKSSGISSERGPKTGVFDYYFP